MQTLATTKNLDLAPPLWLLSLDGAPSSDAVWDRRFESFLKKTLPDVQAAFWDETPLLDAVRTFVSGNPEAITLEGGRYLTFSGCVAHAGHNRGLLWIDAGSAFPTTAFAARYYFQPGKEKVAIYFQDARPESRLPPQFLATLLRWLTGRPGERIVELAIYGGSGTLQTIEPRDFGLPKFMPASGAEALGRITR